VSDERELRALRAIVCERLPREHDLFLCAQPLAAGEFAHHVAVGIEAHGRVVSQLLGDLHDREPALVNEQRRERVPEVVRPGAAAIRPRGRG
jgi:hypothetical protein